MIKIDRGKLKNEGFASEITADFGVLGMYAASEKISIILGHPSKAFNAFLNGAYMKITDCTYKEVEEIPMETKAKLIIDFLTDKNGTDGVPIPRKGIDY